MGLFARPPHDVGHVTHALTYARIDAKRAAHGVEPICRVLHIAPSGYYTHRARLADPGRRLARAQRDDVLREAIRRVHLVYQEVYRPRKVWLQLRRASTRVARCTLERLTRAEGLKGALRGQRVRTTRTAELASERPSDLVRRQLRTARPNGRWVADFTYVAA